MILLQILFHCLWPCIAIANEASYQKSAQDFSGYSLIQTFAITTLYGSTLVSQRSIGTTHEGRSINMISIALNDGKKKAGILIDCGIHAREWISPAFCMYAIDQLVRQPGYLLRMYDFYIVPVLNPDGYAHTWISIDDVKCGIRMCRLWRRNRKPVEVSQLNPKVQSHMQLSWKEQFQEAIKNFPGISYIRK